MASNYVNALKAGQTGLRAASAFLATVIITGCSGDGGSNGPPPVHISRCTQSELSSRGQFLRFTLTNTSTKSVSDTTIFIGGRGSLQVNPARMNTKAFIAYSKGMLPFTYRRQLSPGESRKIVLRAAVPVPIRESRVINCAVANVEYKDGTEWSHGIDILVEDAGPPFILERP